MFETFLDLRISGVKVIMAQQLVKIFWQMRELLLWWSCEVMIDV